jgi:hypothetical protein
VSTFDDIDRGRLIYTCNCGWVDLGHANPTRTLRPHIGAVTLWEDIQKELGTRSEYDSGFLVVYSQDMVKWRLSAAETGHYFVRSRLDLKQKKAIALAIFQEISMRFETMQGSFPYGIFSGDSSFSQEDLVSNLIGFYKAVYPDIDFIGLCDPVSRESSKQVWKTSGGVGSRKNRTFKPLYKTCTDCRGAPTFPKELQEITAATKDEAHPPTRGAAFRNWVYAHDEKTAIDNFIREHQWRMSREPKF